MSRVVHDPAHAAIVRSIVQLGHILGLSVVAEGTETTAEHARVAALGADIAQGYLIARPSRRPISPAGWTTETARWPRRRPDLEES